MRWKRKPPAPRDTWFRWWAWYPVATEDGMWVWLEDVWVKGHYYGYTGDWDWTYNTKPQKPIISLRKI